jgi:hypothetical protein
VTARLLLAAALLAMACGRKAPPIAPELVRPEPPEDLSAIATPDGVKLTWLRPMKYSGGARMNDLAGFAIERATADGEAVEFAPVAQVTVQDQERFRKERHMEWIDHSATPGTRYLYRVRARTLDDYESSFAGPIAIRFGPESPAPPPATPKPATPTKKKESRP